MPRNDVMHCICLGVMKRLLNLWTKVRNPARLSVQKISELSISLRYCSKYLPNQFKRKIRTIEHLEKWKATEFRTFLLYVGPLV